eukprot:scaffold4672_cov129-Isochrysis_galbana.AAC.5
MEAWWQLERADARNKVVRCSDIKHRLRSKALRTAARRSTAGAPEPAPLPPQCAQDRQSPRPQRPLACPNHPPVHRRPPSPPHHCWVLAHALPLASPFHPTLTRFSDCQPAVQSAPPVHSLPTGILHLSDTIANSDLLVPSNPTPNTPSRWLRSGHLRSGEHLTTPTTPPPKSTRQACPPRPCLHRTRLHLYPRHLYYLWWRWPGVAQLASPPNFRRFSHPCTRRGGSSGAEATTAERRLLSRISLIIARTTAHMLTSSLSETALPRSVGAAQTGTGAAHSHSPFSAIDDDALPRTRVR